MEIPVKNSPCHEYERCEERPPWDVCCSFHDAVDLRNWLLGLLPRLMITVQSRRLLSPVPPEPRKFSHTNTRLIM